MIRVTGISWLGVGAENFESAFAFFTAILGLEVAASGPDVAMLRAGSAQIVELFGPASRGKALTVPPVAAFEVEDVAEARDHLIAHGVETLGPIGAWNGFEWLYFRGPEGHVYAVKKTPPPGWEAGA